jgi:hypothetical protein
MRHNHTTYCAVAVARVSKINKANRPCAGTWEQQFGGQQQG